MVYDDRITGLCEGIAELVKPVRIIIFNENVRVYNYEQWNTAIQDPGTFAFRGILNGGVVLYESE